LLVLQQGRSNHEALDLARALVDLGDLRVAEVALDGEVGEVAVAAEDLHRLLGGAVGDLRGKDLGHRRLGGVALAGVLLHGRAPRIPSLSSGRPRLNPGASVGRRKAEMPWCPLLASVTANRITTSATGPLVMKFLVPDSTQPSPSRRAVVLSPAASEPASGSD